MPATTQTTSVLPPSQVHEDRTNRMNNAAAHQPVVRYSKYKIQIAAQKRGLWDQLKEAIAAAGLADSWTNVESKELTSDNEQLVAALPTIREMFGSELVDTVLKESIAE